jgi:four helix bundle protein
VSGSTGVVEYRRALSWYAGQAPFVRCPGVRDHTSIIAWQEARLVAIGILRLSQSHWKPFASAACDQIERASLSVQLNIAEGYALTNTPSFRRHLTMAYGSAAEPSELLEVLGELDIVPASAVRTLWQGCRRSQRLLLGQIHRRGKPA